MNENNSAKWSLKRVFRSIGKIFLIFLCIVISLLLATVVLVQFKSFRQFALNKVLNVVTSKTHSVITADDLHFYVNGYVRFDGLYAEDVNSDTLIYAREISVQLNLKDLFNGNINIQKVELNDAVANIIKKDSLFNFSFIIESLASDSSVTDTTASKSELHIDKIHLVNTRMNFSDSGSGTDLAMILGDLNIKVDSFDLKELKFALKSFEISNSNIVIVMKKGDAKKSTEKSLLPDLSLGDIRLEKFNFEMSDQTNGRNITYATERTLLKDLSVDLNTNNISADELNSFQSRIYLSEKAMVSKVTQIVDTISEGTHLSLSKLMLTDNEIKINNTALTGFGNKFNTENFRLHSLNSEISNVKFSSDSILATVSSLSVFLDEQKEKIFLSGTYLKSKNEISASDMIFTNHNTKMIGDLSLKFQAQEAKNSFILDNSVFDIKKLTLDTKDLLYFVPDSLERKYFEEPFPLLNMSVNANGNLQRMIVNRLNFQAGNTTILQANLILTDIDKPEILGFDIKDFSLATTKTDLQLIPVPGIIPPEINLPEMISMTASGEGKLKNFNIKSVITTSSGKIDIIVSRGNNNTFSGDIAVEKLNVGKLFRMEDKAGEVTMHLKIDGSGTDLNTISSKVSIEASSVFYNNYNYHNLSVNGDVKGKSFAGVIMLNDSNAEFRIDGIADLNEGKEMVKARVDIEGVNLQKLKFSKENIRFSSNATIDFNGLKYDSLEGNLAVHNIIIVKNENIYRLDSLLFASVNDSTGNKTKMESAVLTAEFNGAFSPVNLVPELKGMINRYFPVSDTLLSGSKNDFNFRIALRNHPVLKDVFFPALDEFSTIEITGGFNKQADEFNTTINMPYLKYSGMKLENFILNISSDSSSLTSNIGFKELSNDQFKIDSTSVNAILKDSSMNVSILNLYGERKKLSFATTVKASSFGDYLLLLPQTFILNNEEWSASGLDSIHLRKDLPVTISIDFAKQDEHVEISRDEKGNGKVSFKAFQIANLFQLVSRDSSLAEGSLDGDIVLASTSLSGNLYLNDLIVKKYPVGDFYLEAIKENKGFSFKSTLEGNENNASFSGTSFTKDSVTRINVDADLKSISMKTIEGFSMGNLNSSSGTLSGKFNLSGISSELELSGKLNFKDVQTIPTAINSKFSIPNSNLEIDNKKILFNDFSMRDNAGKLLVVDGYIDMKNMSDPDISINISSEEFELFNSPKSQKKMFYGRLIADSKIDITGSAKKPVIKARLGIKKGTDFTFAIPKSSSESDRGSSEVVFKTDRLNEILTSGNVAELGKSEVRNFNVESLLEIDKGAILRILPDPDSGDSLIVQGAAALNFALDKTGRMSLTGSYELDAGSYVVSLENLVKKRFEIQQGSRIDWNGDPMNAEIDLKAMYEVRTSPADLLANEFSGDASANNDFKERLPFQVFLFLKGDLKAPVITFEIQLPAGSRGALGGMVNEKLILLNNDPSELNKQVFALLVLNRFIQEDPLASSTNGSASENLARSSVSRFLSNQLNKLSSQYINGVELNFDLQSYNDYGSNSGEGRTELAVGIKKNINDRISVQVGGSVEVEGARAKENSLSDWTGDFTVEYKLTEDGEYRLKGFRRNQYEGLIEGQLVETGVGLLFVKDFDLWKDLFKSESDKKNKSDVPEKK